MNNFNCLTQSCFSSNLLYISRKNVLDQIWKGFNTKKELYWKKQDSSYQVRQISVLFRKVVALILGENSVKYLRFTKIMKQIKFTWVWSVLEARNCFRRQSFTKYSRQIHHNSVSTNNTFALVGGVSTRQQSNNVFNFPDISWFSDILSLIPFDKSWLNSYVLVYY